LRDVIALKFGAVHVAVWRAAICCAAHGQELRKFPALQLDPISGCHGFFERYRGRIAFRRGNSFQALLRNPLADPYVLEFPAVQRSARYRIAARAASCAVARNASVLPAGRISWRVGGDYRVYFLADAEGRIDSSTLLLGGVITASLLSAVIILLLNTMPAATYANGRTG